MVSVLSGVLRFKSGRLSCPPLFLMYCCLAVRFVTRRNSSILYCFLIKTFKSLIRNQYQRPGIACLKAAVFTALALKALAVYALADRGVGLVRSYRYAAQRAVVLRLTMMLTFVYRALDAVVCVFACAAVHGWSSRVLTLALVYWSSVFPRNISSKTAALLFIAFQKNAAVARHAAKRVVSFTALDFFGII